MMNGSFAATYMPEEAVLKDFCRMLMDHHPGALTILDKRENLPIHIAAREGIPWAGLLVEAFPPGLLRKGGKNGLYPFQLAALSWLGSIHERQDETFEKDGDVNTKAWRLLQAVERTFLLLSADPSALALAYT